MPNGMLLAAGRGTRLAPLTEFLPKPLLPVANQPVMARGLACLRHAGITDVFINVCYRGQQLVDVFGNGRAHGVKLHWSVESTPAGTAGALKLLQPRLDGDTIVVVSADAMIDCPLDPLLAAHRESGALVTLVTTTVNDPSLYGVVLTNARGRVTAFQEKPAPGTAISHQANTGIYLVEPEVFTFIPYGEFYDFALHLFPAMLRLRLPLAAVNMAGYWRDIGNPGDYLQANLDFLDGRIAIEGHGCREYGNCIAPTAWVEGTLLHRCVVGEQARIARGSVLTDCVIWPHTVLHYPLTLSSAILTPQGAYLVKGRTAIRYDELVMVGR